MSRCNRASLDRSGKAGLFFILLLAVAAAGAVYWFKFRQIEAQAGPRPATLPSTPNVTSGVTSTPVPAGITPPAPGVKKPTSIFEDASDGTPGDPVAPAPVLKAPTPLDAQKLKSLQTAASDAATALEAARAKAKASPTLTARVAEVAELKAQLDEARRTGTPQEKVAASGKWNKARLSLEEDQKKGVETDPAVVQAKAAVEHADKALSDFRAGK